MFRTITGAAIGALILIPAAPVAAAAFVNGDFEQPGGSTAVYLDAGGNPNYVTGWTDSQGPNRGLDLYENESDYGLAAEDGSYYVSFGGDTTSGGTLSQTFDVVSGASYTISYYVAEQQGDSPDQVLRATVTNGAQSVSADNGSLGPTFAAGKSLSFIAISNSATLSFFDATPVGGGGPSNIALDAVKVTGTFSSAVPEPAMWSMLVCGFGAVGGALRRRPGADPLATRRRRLA